MSCTAQCASGNHAAFAFGSSQDDWELVAANVSYFWPSGLPPSPTWLTRNLMMYTPDASYTPIQNFSPAGFYVPGLQTDWSFTLGSVKGFVGYNGTLPGIFGSFPFETHNTSSSSTPLVSVDFQTNEVRFDPPIRIYRDVTLGFILIETFSRSLDVTLTIRYRLRSRTTDGPRTG